MAEPNAPSGRRWTDDAIWDAVDAWRWVPPSAARVGTDDFELIVTPGAFHLTYVYGFRVDPPDRADAALREAERRITELGGNGTRFQWTPRLRPADLAHRLEAHGYYPLQETEVFAWELRDGTGAPQLPDFRPTPGIEVREVSSAPEFEEFLRLSGEIFGDPVPSGTLRTGFVAEYERNLRETGHSDRYLALDGPRAIGRAGLQLAGPVARFWGTGVLEGDRGRGVYGALVRTRCETAVRRGAELALVIARVGTSGPILRHHGFRPIGAVRIYETRFSEGAGRDRPA